MSQSLPQHEWELDSGNPEIDPRIVTMRHLYAKKGDVVTCERGHHIVTFSRDVRWGEMFDPKALVDWQQPEPKIGEIAPRCVQCGAMWCAGNQYHFEDGWRV